MNPKQTFALSAFLRALFLIFSAVVLSAILCIPALASCFLSHTGRWPSFFQRLWVNSLLRANGIRLQVQGLENLRKGQSYIFISNHASLLDIPGIISVVPFATRFIAKKTLIWLPIFGWFLSWGGHILIDRDSALSALKSIKKGAALLARGISIIIFPEGTRSPDGQVKEFKKGAFLLARQSKAPLVPLSISGTFEMLPRRGWCFWPGTIEICFDKPIPAQGLAPQEMSRLREHVRERVIQNLQSEGRRSARPEA